MPALNVLSNLFTTLYNNETRRKKECIVMPASRFASEILRTMQKHRYIGEFEQIDDDRAGKFRIQLLAKINKCGIITPRFSVKTTHIWFGRDNIFQHTVWAFYLYQQAVE